MKRDRPLEIAVFCQDLLVLALSRGVASLAREGLRHVVPGSRPFPPPNTST
jgi:hypothetical protein